MEGRLLDRIAKPFNIQTDGEETLDERIDRLLPEIGKHSEDLDEEDYYVNRHFREVRDDEQWQDVVLYVFEDGGRLRIATNGKMDSGSWEMLNEKIIIGAGMRGGLLYTRAFLNGDVIILRHHGGIKMNGSKYLFLVIEPLAAQLEWYEVLDQLEMRYRNSSTLFIVIAVAFVLAIVLFMLLSQD